MGSVVLHNFWASSCSWRVRAALHLKNIKFEERAVDIVTTKDQLTDKFKAINPAQKFPALEIDGVTVVESMAILQYIEETRPLPSLLPSTPLLRARMREIVETIVSGIQPLQNVGLKRSFETEAEYDKFSRFWTHRGLQTLEELVKKSSNWYCVGDNISWADLCLVPQIFNAVGRLELDIAEFPTVSRLYSLLLKEKCFIDTHPRIFKPKTRL